MPQMKPMLWLYYFFLFLLIFVFYNILNFYFKNFYIINNVMKINTFQCFWKW